MKQIAKHIALSAMRVFRSELFVEQTATVLWLLTSNALVRGGGARSAGESPPLAGWAADQVLFALLSLPCGFRRLLKSLPNSCTTFLTRRQGHATFQCLQTFVTQARL